MSRLELPSKGIHPDRYDRIVADTIAQMNAFTPEAEAVNVVCYNKENGLTYVWTGSAWELG